MTAVFNLAGTIRLVPTWEDTIGPASLSDTTTFLQTLEITDGTGSGQADAYWRDVITLAGSTSWAYDGDVLPLEIMGASGTLALSAVRLLYVRNRSTTQKLQWVSDFQELDIAPGGTFLWIAPSTVTVSPFIVASVSNPGATAATFEILIVGVKA